MVQYVENRATNLWCKDLSTTSFGPLQNQMVCPLVTPVPK